MSTDAVAAKTMTASRQERIMLWTGRVISGLIACLFILSGTMKLVNPAGMTEGLGHLGIPESMLLPLGILELACVLVYLVPATSVLGAVLLTGYLGGAICTHWRVGDAFPVQVVMGLAVWGGLYLRDRRLRALLPLRRQEPVAGREHAA